LQYAFADDTLQGTAQLLADWARQWQFRSPIVCTQVLKALSFLLAEAAPRLAEVWMGDLDMMMGAKALVCHPRM
jgi:hypothetical protein